MPAECGEARPCKRPDSMLVRGPGLGPGQITYTPSSPENKWHCVQRGDGIDGDHPCRPGSGTARRGLDSLLVARCHLPLSLFVCLGVASAGRPKNGCALGLEVGYTPSLLESAVSK